MAIRSGFAIGPTAAQHSNRSVEKPPMIVEDILKPLASGPKLESGKVTFSLPSRATILKVAKIAAGVVVASVAIAVVAAFCLKFLPVLILALAIAGLVYMIQNSKQAKEPEIVAEEDPINAIAKLLEGDKIEEGIFTPDEFLAMAQRGRNGLRGAFSTYVTEDQNRVGSHAYPYTVRDVESRDTDVIFTYFAQQALGQSDPEQLLQDDKNPEQQRARHVCAFLKLLGDLNRPIDAKISLDIGGINDFIQPWYQPLKAGTLSTTCIKEESNLILSFTVSNEEIALSQIQEGGGQELKMVARFKTSRRVDVSPPDADGNVHYKVTRRFTRI